LRCRQPIHDHDGAVVVEFYFRHELGVVMAEAQRRETLLARTLVQLADNLVDDFDVIELLTLLADRSVEVLDVSAAGLMLASAEGELRVMASSSESMRLLELFEQQSQEGPCFDCFRTGKAVVNIPLDMAAARWPQFTPQAQAAGFHTVHALPMRLRGDVIGALNLFCVTPGIMGEADIEAGQAFADIATIAILQRRAASEALLINTQLHHALNSRIVVEQAKGVIAERRNVDMTEAFRLLRVHARSHQELLAHVARDVVSGALTDAQLDGGRRPTSSP
jgi:transcriptional regulator with GAF, ATPase, and Fis domain